MTYAIDLLTTTVRQLEHFLDISTKREESIRSGLENKTLYSAEAKRQLRTSVKETKLYREKIDDFKQALKVLGHDEEITC